MTSCPRLYTSRSALDSIVLTSGAPGISPRAARALALNEYHLKRLTVVSPIEDAWIALAAVTSCVDGLGAGVLSAAILALVGGVAGRALEAFGEDLKGVAVVAEFVRVPKVDVPAALVRVWKPAITTRRAYFPSTQ